MRYNPALDGLRAVAALVVLLFHLRVPGFQGGYLGVDIFFVLSGYLITHLLLKERIESGRIDLWAFYRNRALRLYPALLGLLAVYLVLGPIFWPEYPHRRDALIAGTYIANYAIDAGVPMYYLFHTWTLAVEEQFYLLWPLALLYLVARHPLRLLPKSIATLVVLALGWRMFQEAIGNNASHPLEVRLAGLMAGGWLAAMNVTRPGWITYPRACMVAGAIGLCTMNLIGIHPTHPMKAYVALPVAELSTVLMLCGANQLPLTHPVLVWLGKMSYGIYLWHFPLVRLWSYADYGIWRVLLVLLVSIALAALSYYTIEAWARAWRARIVARANNRSAPEPAS